ncbi:uncharacterized protein DNG_01024 [Cephalotrichum gorgonifer]|uniref:Uncharacterized protein n=1 Tax=Cephalotrichum gorgonifer TaxID=2041049 RepID=A0AAE8SRT0_9PEZI|nr:uncharacterized protein DNG_01024 [Cephalotrichum gorgonifer]
MGLPLYVAKSPSPEPNVKTKSKDKIPGPRRSIRRRARVNDLARDPERERARLRQRAAFIANYVNERSSDEDRVPPRDRHMAVVPLFETEPGERPTWARHSYISSILDSIRSGVNDLRDRGRDNAEGDNLTPYPIPTLLRPAESLFIEPDRPEDDAGPGVWRERRSTDGPSRNLRDHTDSLIDRWELYLDQSAHNNDYGAGLPDGLGDRERSMSPDPNGTWDTLLTTLTPDPQPPSAGSSFASTPTATSQSAVPSALATQRPSQTREPAASHECGVCDRCLRRRANIASMRSRGPPVPSALPNDIPPYSLPGRRTHRNLYPVNLDTYRATDGPRVIDGPAALRAAARAAATERDSERINELATLAERTAAILDRAERAARPALSTKKRRVRLQCGQPDSEKSLVADDTV